MILFAIIGESLGWIEYTPVACMIIIGMLIMCWVRGGRTLKGGWMNT